VSDNGKTPNRSFMKLKHLIFRSLIHYRRTNLPVIAGVAVAVAVLSGALLVGQSVRQSLRDLLYERIGATEYAVAADHFFSEDLAEALAQDNAVCPLIYLKGTVIHEGKKIRVHDVNIYGIDERFWEFHGISSVGFSGNREALIGAPIAHQLDAAVGDGLLLRVEIQQAIPREWLYGQRDNVGRTIRLNCGSILPENSLGEFALRPSQGNVYSIFVPLKRLQRDLDQPSRVNTILLASRDSDSGMKSIRASLKAGCTLADLGLKLRIHASGDGFSLVSNRIILDDSTVQAAFQAAVSLGMKDSPVYTYLANSIHANGRSIPYSVITAADLHRGAMTAIDEIKTVPEPSAQKDSTAPIWLTDWAWRDLGLSLGDSVEVDYYFWQENRQLVTRTARFHLAGVLAISGDVDDTLAPEIPGVTDADTMSGWDPPFPLDLTLIRRKDEEYWNRYRATPKAFITLSKGKELWRNRFGELTSLRFSLPDDEDLESSKRIFPQALLENLDPEHAGFVVNPIKEQGLMSSRGSTNFGEYFVYFSFFLIASALLLSTLFFRLTIEQRAREIGILQAAGFAIRLLRRTFLLEGLFLALSGSILGLLGGIAYGWLMVFGLRGWWIGAVGTERLSLHISWIDLFAGAAGGLLFSMAAILWTLRDLQRNSPRSLLTGVLESHEVRRRRARTLMAAALLALTTVALLLWASADGEIDQIYGFFGTGFLLLVSILCFTALYLRRAHPDPIRGHGRTAFFRLGLRNAMYRPGRSLLCASLIASATFIIVSVESFRKDTRSDTLEAKSGTGGYAYIAESDLPVIHNLNTSSGLEAAGILQTQIAALSKMNFVSFRERPGDDASCLNLYAPQNPKILGVPRSFITAERFSFQNSLASTPKEELNPWLLLESSSQENAIPAIAGADTIQYILHLSLGSELTVSGAKGKSVRLRLVAALSGSIFQGVLLISESNFLRIFPENEGYRFFLLENPNQHDILPIQQLKENLSDWGFNIESSLDRLEAYHRVENTFISAFQSLGFLGLILGTIGLAAVLLRNVLERSKELALLRAVGYQRRILSGIIFIENVLLIAWGLVSGSLCAILAIVPALHARGASFPLAMTGFLLASVLATGLISSLVAVVAAFRSPLITALHSE
jgi:putative ABC transport system permease protein